MLTTGPSQLAMHVPRQTRALVGCGFSPDPHPGPFPGEVGVQQPLQGVWQRRSSTKAPDGVGRARARAARTGMSVAREGGRTHRHRSPR